MICKLILKCLLSLFYQLIPQATHYKFKQTNKRCSQFGIGEPISKIRYTREKFDADQLNHFIDFITSGHIIKDQPFGEKTLKLNGGEIIQIASVIRSLAPSTITSQYTTVCKEENIKPLGNVSKFKIELLSLMLVWFLVSAWCTHVCVYQNKINNLYRRELFVGI